MDANDEKDIIKQSKSASDHEYYFVGALVGLCSALFGASIYVITTKVGKEVTTTMQLLYMAFFALLISCFLPFVDENDRFFTSKMAYITAYDWGLYVALSCSGIFGFWLAFMSCRMIKPAIVSTLRTTEIIVAFLVQSFLSNTVPELTKSCGALFVLLAALALIFEKHLYNGSSKLLYKDCILMPTSRYKELKEETV